jgi:hypothetical protein
MPLEVRSVENLLGTPVPYAYALKAGPWLFLTGHEAYDWRTGMVDEAVSGPPGYPLFGHHHKSRRETDFIFNRMRRVLAEFGTDFAHSVRLDQYYPIARVKARRTRTSSNGFLWWFGVIRFPQFQSLS